MPHALAEFVRGFGRKLDPKPVAFEDIVIKGSSVVRFPAGLLTRWPGTRIRCDVAGVKVDTPVSVRGNGPKTLALVGERTADIQLLKIGAWGRNRNLLFDLGSCARRLFVKSAERGGILVSRRKESADPLFVRSLLAHPGRAIDLDGERLSEMLPRLQSTILDAEVELSFQRRVYVGC